MILKPSFDVHCASGGEEALRIIKEQKVDLVTLDLNMPGVKGLEVLRSLRSESPTTEVIIVTGFATVESAVEGIRYGVHDFITKPFDIAEVMSAVESALRKKPVPQAAAPFPQWHGRFEATRHTSESGPGGT